MNSRHNWTQEQDEYLRKQVPQFGKRNWVIIAKNFNSVFPNKTKTSKQCRQRFINHSSINKELIDSNQWCEDDYRKLFYFYGILGPKWTKISQVFPGKAQNSIKNKLYCCLRKFVRKINRIIKASKKKSYKQILPKSIFRIIDAVQSFQNLSLELKQIASLIKERILCYSNPNNNEVADSEIINLISEINHFNLKSRSYKCRKSVNKVSNQNKSHIDINTIHEDSSKSKEEIFSGDRQKNQTTNLGKTLKQNQNQNQMDHFISLQDLPFEQYGIEYNDKFLRNIPSYIIIYLKE